MVLYPARAPTRVGATTALLATLCLIPSPTRASDERVADRLRRYQTPDAVSEFLGSEPRNCVPGSPTTQVCSWVLGKRDKPGWRMLRRLLHTRDRIRLVCTFTTPPSEEDRCVARPRRTNRKRWESSSPSRRQSLAERAQAALRTARTIAEMSVLMGIGPDSCQNHPGESLVTCS